MIRILPLFLLLALVACETVKGVGRDITQTAETVKQL